MVTCRVVIKVISGIITPESAVHVGKEGSLMEWFAQRQEFQSQVRVNTHRSSIVVFERGGFCQHKTNRTRVWHSRASDVCRNLYRSLCGEKIFGRQEGGRDETRLKEREKGEGLKK